MEKSTEKELSPFEKIIKLNQLGALFLSAGKYEKSHAFLKKTVEMYEQCLEKKEIPKFVYTNLFCNYAKSLSCLKMFDEAKEYYLQCINNHPLYHTLKKCKDELNEHFKINFEKLLDNSQELTSEIVKERFEIALNFFKNNKTFEYTQDFKPNRLNSLSSFTDSLVNLAVIFQFSSKKSAEAFEMYYLALLCEPSNLVANVDFNNILRELNYPELSDQFITAKLNYDILNDKDEQPLAVVDIDVQFNKTISQDYTSFVCMNWGTKYGAKYVNKLYNSVSRNFSKPFNFFCITDDATDYNENILTLDLVTDFKGWLKKSLLFSEEYTSNFSERIIFIDLDTVIVSSLDFLTEYTSNFCIMSTEGIQCESAINGYNSSIIMWKNGFGQNIFKNVKKYNKHLSKQIVRFDHYLEFVIKNADLIQSLFPKKIVDYCQECKGKDAPPELASIIMFPRSPKPHECEEKWIVEAWN